MVKFPGELPVEFFTVCTKLAEMAILYSKDLTTAKKMLPPVGLNLVQEIVAGLGVQCLSIWAKLACQVSVERIVLDLESEVMRGLGSIPTGVTFVSKFYNPNLHNIARSDSLGSRRKPDCRLDYLCNFCLIQLIR